MCVQCQFDTIPFMIEILNGKTLTVSAVHCFVVAIQFRHTPGKKKLMKKKHTHKTVESKRRISTFIALDQPKESNKIIKGITLSKTI